jgi:hypothetical protein
MVMVYPQGGGKGNEIAIAIQNKINMAEGLLEDGDSNPGCNS